MTRRIVLIIGPHVVVLFVKLPGTGIGFAMLVMGVSEGRATTWTSVLAAHVDACGRNEKCVPGHHCKNR